MKGYLRVVPCLLSVVAMAALGDAQALLVYKSVPLPKAVAGQVGISTDQEQQADSEGNIVYPLFHDLAQSFPTLARVSPRGELLAPTYRVLDRPTDVLVYSEVGGEALKARTHIDYDQGSLSTPGGTVPNHDNDNFSSGFITRGNTTRITRYADPVGPGGGVERNFTYDTLGNLLTAQLDCCNTRTFTYDSTGFAFPVQVTSGSGPQLSTSATYYSGTLLLNTFTDEAGLMTTYAYDSMDRVTSVTRNAKRWPPLLSNERCRNIAIES